MIPGDRFDEIMKKLLDIVNNIDTYTPKEIIEKMKELDEEIFENIPQKDLEDIIERYLREMSTPVVDEEVESKRNDPIKYIEENDYGDVYTITMEIRGIDKKEVKPIILTDNKLMIKIGNYQKEIPVEIPPDIGADPKFEWTYNNGVLDIKFKRKE